VIGADATVIGSQSAPAVRTAMASLTESVLASNSIARVFTT
jgi:hypothetical protein